MLCNNSVKEYKVMTENEIKLLEVIRENENPEEALLKALEVIILYLNHRESFESILFVDSRESVETTQAYSSHSL